MSRVGFPAAVALALGAVLWPLLDPGAIPVESDLLVFVVPLKRFLGERLREGSLPVWNPNLFLGVPFLATLQAGVGYPPSLLLALPFPLGLNAFLAFHYAVAAIGAWAWIGRSGAGRAARAVGSVVFACGGFLVSLLPRTNHLQGASLAPWVLLAAARLAERPCGKRFAVLSGALALQVLAGSPEIAILTFAAAALLSLGGGVRALARLSSALFVSLSLDAFQLLPTLKYVADSTRSRPIPAAQVFHGSFRPESFLGVVFRDVPPGGWIESAHVGLVAASAAVAALAARPRAALPWAGILLGSAGLALGDRLPALPALYGLAPELVGKFRFPEKFLFLAHLALALLAALGTDAILNGAPRARAASAAAAALLGALGLRWNASPGRIGTAAAGLFAVLLLASRRVKLSALALAALVGLELASASSGRIPTRSFRELLSTPLAVDVRSLRERGLRIFHYRSPAEPAASGLESAPEAVETAPDPDLVLWQGLFGDLPLVHGVATLSAAEGLLPAFVRDLRDLLPALPRERAIGLLRTFSVGALVGPHELSSPGLEEATPPGFPLRVYRVREPVPLAYLARRVEAGPAGSAALARLAAPGFRPGEEALVAGVSGDELPSGEGPPGTAEIAERSDSRTVVEVAADRRVLLVLNEAFAPGWTARVDGVETRILCVNGAVRGVLVDAGEHTVEFAYRPASLRAGIAISGATLVGLAALAARRRAA